MMDITRRPVFRRLSIGVVGIGIVTSAVVGGTAQANAATTSSPVPGTSCTVAQVERTLATQNPAVYQKIMASETAQSGLIDILSVSREERQRRWSQSPPAGATGKRLFLGAKGWSKDERHNAESAIESAVSSCSTS